MDSPTTEEDRGELTPEEHERLTTGLIEAYSRLRGLDFVQHRVRPRHMKMWRRLAKELYDRGIPLRRYIYWAYNKQRRHGPIVFVERIASLKTLQWYTKEAPDREHDIAVLVRLQWATLKAALDEGQTPREIIEDPDLELGVVFKYALAQHANLTDLAAAMKSEAESEIYFEPAYRKNLSGFLPAE
jgi:hypothetical protein